MQLLGLTNGLNIMMQDWIDQAFLFNTIPILLQHLLFPLIF